MAATPRPTPADAPGSAWTGRLPWLLLLLFLVALVITLWGEVIGRAFDDPDPIVHVPNYDFYQYYAGGHNWDLGLDPYRNHPGVAGAIQHPRDDDPGITGFIYPPTALPVYGALAHYSYDQARSAWLALNVLVFVGALAAAVACTPGRRLALLVVVLLLVVASFPFVYHVHNGQIDLIVSGLTVTGFLLHGRWRSWPTAALLATAIVLKVSPAIILLALVVYWRDWRLLVKTAACAAALAAASLAAVHPGLYREYVTTVMSHISNPNPSRYNQTVTRFWWRQPAAAKVLSLCGYAALLFLVAIAGRAGRRLGDAVRKADTRTEARAVLLLAVVFMLLFSPVAWQMAYVWTILPVALLLAAPLPRAGAKALILLACGAVLMESRDFHWQALSTLNLLGAGLTLFTVLAFYLPLRSPAVAAEGQVEAAAGERAPAS
jgi:hypothetical protein